MKKKTVLLFSAVFAVAGLLMGCGSSKDKVVTNEDKGGQTTEIKGSLKTGLAVSASISGSKDAGEEEGLAQTDVMVAAVTVDEEGKIVSCTIDSAQVGVNFSKKGKITTDLETQYETKQELGEKYGMKKASSIGKEWNEQADAFAAYCVGKTADEIGNMAVTEKGAPADADLASSCTIYAGGLQAIVIKAVDNAK